MAEYIDKEAFKKSVEERYCKPCKAEKKDHNGCWCRSCWVDDMLDEVECFQIADVAPVVHGLWEQCFEDWRKQIEGDKCSICGFEHYSALITHYHYCPNCGAKMDIKDGGDKQRLIDADALIGKFNEKVDMTERLVNERTAERFATFCALADSVEEMPTVDAEVVVRCKDCKYSTLPSELTKRYGVPGTLTCHNRYSPCNRRNVGGNDFCSYGERKDYIEN